MSRHAVARADSIHIESIGDELVVFDELTQQSHSLDAMATSVFRAADGTRSLADLATVTGLHESQVSTALAGLGAASLVSLPAELSRRALLARGAVVGGVALASPAILSVMAPSLAMAASGTGGGAGGGGATVVFTETWESDTPSGPYQQYNAGQSFGQWTVNTGSVDVVQGSFYTTEQATSTVLDTAGAAPGQISTTGFTAGPGSYTVTFDVVKNSVGDPTDKVGVSLGDATGTVTPTATTFSDPGKTKSITLTVTTAGPLSISCVGTGGPNGYGGPIVDNITVTHN